jgi:hypothetical protein
MELNFYQLTSFVQEWITLKDVIMLNSATTNSEIRIDLHRIVHVDHRKYYTRLLKKYLTSVTVRFPLIKSSMAFIPFRPHTLDDYKLFDYQVRWESLAPFAIYHAHSSCSAMSNALIRHQNKVGVRINYYSNELMFETKGGMCAIFFHDGPYIGNVNSNWLRDGDGIQYYTTIHGYDHSYHRDCFSDGEIPSVYIESSLDFYVGEWKEGWEVKGKRTFKNGDTYDGMWSEGLPHGKGVMYYLRSGEHYTGDWMYGSPHGEGSLYCAHSELYKGNWYHGVQNPMRLKKHVFCPETKERSRLRDK